MLNKKIATLKNNRNILNNIFSLLVLQGSKYIIPLILLPYLVRTLGIETFGLLAFITATLGILRGIVSYGFDFSGTKQISLEQGNKNKISEIFSSIIFAKLFISIIAFLILCILYLLIDKIQENFIIFIFGFLIVFGEVIFPSWFFQGIEKMKIITYLTIIYKFIFMVLVILTVKSNEDLYLVLLLDSIGSILIGIYSIFYVSKHYKINIYIPKSNQIYFQLKNGWHIFLSRITVILYSTFNTFLLGILTTNELVGIYSLAEKIYLALKSLLNPFVQAFFPYLTKRFKENQILYYKLIKQLLFISFFIILIISSMTYGFSKEIIELIAGKYIEGSTDILKIFSLSLLFSTNSFFTIFLMIKSKERDLTKITMFLFLINIILVFPVIEFFSIYGLAYLFLLVQIIQTILQYFYNIEIFKNKYIKGKD
ncbi:MAG: oligosaccharide flippase family protein [Aliarcobacter sp.]|jgi:PST family polysaccharide transporter|nr:oligosaccharide flippase family protein [Aliarcobacter sp.]